MNEREREKQGYDVSAHNINHNRLQRNEVTSIQSSREKALAELEELRSKTSTSDAQFATQLEEAQTTAAGQQACTLLHSC